VHVRGLNGDYAPAPEVVASPEVVAVLDWAGGKQAAVTPFCGGSRWPSLEETLRLLVAGRRAIPRRLSATPLRFYLPSPSSSSSSSSEEGTCG
jgi:hypothetical protein